jgi:DNA segregation ATPase FtsK/SpoIIIE, S-DNA-T family
MTENPNITPENAMLAASFVHKLEGLGIKATLQRIENGPVVTAFYLKLGNSVPISRIVNKSEDFALAAGVDAVNIQRIRDEIAIFASKPSEKRQNVDFKQTLDFILRDENARKAIIPIPLGVDHTGKPAFIDLVHCPHILLAGATGSGKSVFESAILATLAVAKSLRQLYIYTVDTKQLDLPLFRDLPIVESCATSLVEYLQLMTGLLKEHERRATSLKNASIRNIADYNQLVGEDNAYPYILLMIDEFADLIMQDREAKKDKEHAAASFPKADFLLQRVAQIGRATGIHIIAATQRTSVKIINGDIKANFPCRISLRLPTQTDSFTILGTGGAESLLGKGDMFVQYPEKETLERFHGPFVKHEDVVQVVTHCTDIKRMYEGLNG